MSAPEDVVALQTIPPPPSDIFLVRQYLPPTMFPISGPSGKILIWAHMTKVYTSFLIL
jgi:hypothetical protein